jgi:N utilization substance protein A
LKSEQIPGDSFKVGDRLKVFVTEVKGVETRGPIVTLSRIHPKMVQRLFELEIPEIQDGTVLIKSVSRDAGSRTKIAVCSRDENVDPVGACIGNKGMRIGAILNELGNEKIDVIRYDEDPAKFVAAALAPATILSVELEGERTCRVTVSPDQLSLAIGKEGQNAKLAAKLTGYKIDIKA